MDGSRRHRESTLRSEMDLDELSKDPNEAEGHKVFRFGVPFLVRTLSLHL